MTLNSLPLITNTNLFMSKLTYKIVKKGLFESIEKFENRLNELATEGWIAVSISSEHNNSVVVLMKKER